MSLHRLRAKPKLGISACLLGAEVRYNGGHKSSRFCREQLSQYFDFVPLCPEVAIGLGTPREPIRLVGDPRSPRAVGTRHPEREHTQALSRYAQEVAQPLSQLCGYILMQQSPSCGLERVKLYHENGQPSTSRSRGIFAQALCTSLPNLPMEEDGRLKDPVLCENFISRACTYAEWLELRSAGLSRAGLLAFHARHKYLLMACAPLRYKRLGQLLGELGNQQLEPLAERYISELMQALHTCATRSTHSNVLQHLSGYFKRVLSRLEKQEMQKLINQYRNGIVPLVVPLTLLKHHLSRHPDAYLAEQAYLQPYPENLSLRNAL
jgi:uncharacterized protein YbgA (DUF1722 family)/uncharacterized protein YbbK (DUF523 family)